MPDGYVTWEQLVRWFETEENKLTALIDRTEGKLDAHLKWHASYTEAQLKARTASFRSSAALLLSTIAAVAALVTAIAALAGRA